jgi:hypothetical protein
LYNNQRNAHVFTLFIYLLLLTCFGIYFRPSSEAGVQFQQCFKSPVYGISTRVLTQYPRDLNHCRNCTPASEDGLKESPKHVIDKLKTCVLRWSLYNFIPKSKVLYSIKKNKKCFKCTCTVIKSCCKLHSSRPFFRPSVRAYGCKFYRSQNLAEFYVQFFRNSS